MDNDHISERDSRTALRRLQHELRTPLGQIIGYSEMLLEEAPAELTGDLERIRHAAEELLGVVDRTLRPDLGVVPAGAPGGESPPDVPPRRSAGRLLVVDDESNNRDLLSRRLGRSGFDVSTAETGVTALRMIEAGRFDVVLLDVMMPGMSGLEVLDAVRRDRSATELPVILATALTDTSDVIEGLRRGANDYVTKPLDFPIVLARVETQLTVVRATRDLAALTQEVELRGRFIRRMFGRYVSDAVADAVLEQSESLELGGEKRCVSILMSDLVGFTAMTESLDAGQVVTVLNNHLGVMTDVIQSHGGTIDEFIGDAILAFFGAPLTRDDDAARAVACALAMQAAMAEVNVKNSDRGLPDVTMRIAVTTGNVVVGNIGSERRSKYAAVGSAINLAARIESQARAGEVLIAESTRLAAGGRLRVEGAREIAAKGFADPVRIHRVTGVDGTSDV